MVDNTLVSQHEPKHIHDIQQHVHDIHNIVKRTHDGAGRISPKHASTSASVSVSKPVCPCTVLHSTALHCTATLCTRKATLCNPTTLKNQVLN